MCAGVIVMTSTPEVLPPTPTVVAEPYTPFIGKLREPEYIPFTDGLTNEERWERATRAVEELEDYDFDAWQRQRDFDQKQADLEMAERLRSGGLSL